MERVTATMIMTVRALWFVEITIVLGVMVMTAVWRHQLVRATIALQTMSALAHLFVDMTTNAGRNAQAPAIVAAKT